MAITQKTYRTDRRLKSFRVVSFTVYLDPALDVAIRALAKEQELTLTQLGKRAFRLLLQTEKNGRRKNGARSHS